MCDYEAQNKERIILYVEELCDLFRSAIVK
jgi:hypothetical protein